jgi:hypothetical protein
VITCTAWKLRKKPLRHSRSLKKELLSFPYSFAD